MPRVDASLRRKSSYQLIEDTVELLHDYLEQGSSRTDLLKAAAEHIVELRARHRLDSGDTDWAGRSQPYRTDIAEIYARAGVTTYQERDRLQSALRYHVGNLIRERATAEELERAGLYRETPRDRMHNTREAMQAAASVSGAMPKSLRGDLPRILAYAEALLEFADTQGSLDELEAKQLVSARLSLESINKRSEQLLERISEASAGLKKKRRPHKQN